MLFIITITYQQVLNINNMLPVVCMQSTIISLELLCMNVQKKQIEYTEKSQTYSKSLVEVVDKKKTFYKCLYLYVSC